MNLVYVFGLVSGVGFALFSALTTNFFTQKRERRKEIEKYEFDIYMKLRKLYQYFWIAKAKPEKEESNREIKTKVRNLAWEISDLLGFLDEYELIEDTLKITPGYNYESNFARYEAMNDLLIKLGNKINPQYVEAIRQISKGNEENFKNASTPPSEL